MREKGRSIGLRAPWAVMMIFFLISGPAHASSVINPGTRQWVEAATTGRADMLILGDSITNHGVMGWTGGIADALSQAVGLAGTGLLGGGAPGLYPGRAGGRTLRASDWVADLSQAHAGLGHLSMTTAVNQADESQPGPFFTGLNMDALRPGVNPLLDNTDAYDWQFWLASDEQGGTIQGQRYARTQTPSRRTLVQTTPVVPIAEGFEPLTLPFGATDLDRDWHEFALAHTTNTTIFWQRLIAPERTGATVTGWGYPGMTTRDFVLDLYAPAEGRDQRGRAAHLSALVHGNSGKLNVVIAEGVNDSRDNRLSLQGVAPSSSPEGFVDNIETLIGMIRDDWAAAGFEGGDLSFTLLGPYQVDPSIIGTTRWGLLAQYALALHTLASHDPQLSFVDMWQAGPDWQTAVANNFIHDGIHPSIPGSQLYGSVFVNELLQIPEPPAAWLMAALVLLYMNRGRSRRAPQPG